MTGGHIDNFIQSNSELRLPQLYAYPLLSLVGLDARPRMMLDRKTDLYLRPSEWVELHNSLLGMFGVSMICWIRSRSKDITKGKTQKKYVK